MIDSHTHLDSCEPPNAQLVADAITAGVTRILTVGLDDASSRSALAAAEAFPQVYAAVGRHPTATRGFDQADLAELAALAAHPRCVAIGETGIDLYRDPPPLQDQQRAFSGHVELARELDLPLIVHSRAADDPTLEQLRKEAAGLRVVMHCFSMPSRLGECLERGYWISFAGNVTYKNAADLARAVGEVPEGRLLVETDAPYLAPQPVRGKANTPAFVVHTVAFVAAIRGVDVPTVSATLERNGRALFGW